MLLCFIAGYLIRGNQPIIHFVNYLLYPAQILLIPVYLYVGEWIVGVPHVTINPVKIVELFMSNPGQFFIDYVFAGLYAILAWALITPPIAYVIYLVLRPVFLRFARKAVA